jgi:hypothetical protein
VVIDVVLVKSFDAVLDRQIGRKFVGSLASPFLYIRVIDPVFQQSGTICSSNTRLITIMRASRVIAQFFKFGLQSRRGQEWMKNFDDDDDGVFISAQP